MLRISREYRQARCGTRAGTPSWELALLRRLVRVHRGRAAVPATVHRAPLEQRFVVAAFAEVRAAVLRDDAAARRALDEAELEQVRLVDILDRVGLLTERNGERREADRAAAEALDDRAQQLAVDAFQTELVHLVQVERL